MHNRSYVDSQSDHRDGSRQPDPSAEREEGLIAALRRIVRRVLRTHRQRTVFEGRVLNAAQRLLERHHCFMARDVLEQLVVNELLESLQGDQSGCLSPEYAAPCPYTRVAIRDSTIAV